MGMEKYSKLNFKKFRQPLKIFLGASKNCHEIQRETMLYLRKRRSINLLYTASCKNGKGARSAPFETVVPPTYQLSALLIVVCPAC